MAALVAYFMRRLTVCTVKNSCCTRNLDVFAVVYLAQPTRTVLDNTVTSLVRRDRRRPVLAAGSRFAESRRAGG